MRYVWVWASVQHLILNSLMGVWYCGCELFAATPNCIIISDFKASKRYVYGYFWYQRIMIVSNWYNRNTLWLRDTVRQTSRGKSAAAGPTASAPAADLRDTVRQTSLGKSAAGGDVPQSIPFIQYVHIRCWIKNDCANCALKWEIQWFGGELFIHTCMPSSAKWADVTCQVKPEGRRPDPLFPRTAPGP